MSDAVLLAPEFDPMLVEHSVLAAVERLPADARARFRRRRDVLYEIADVERREAEFHRLAASWFDDLGLARPVLALLEELPILGRSVSRCLVLQARQDKEQGADLYRSLRGDRAPGLVIRLGCTTLLDPDALGPLLRHELRHVADMLDPSFGYDPEFRHSKERLLDNLIRARHHLLWDLTIDGRLAASGLLPASVEEVRRRELAAMFPGLGEHADEVFWHFFRKSSTTHRELLDFAVDPSGGSADGHCPVCRFPGAPLDAEHAGLTPAAVWRIRSDSPEWRPEVGICRQCADLYLLLAVTDCA